METTNTKTNKVNELAKQLGVAIRDAMQSGEYEYNARYNYFKVGNVNVYPSGLVSASAMFSLDKEDDDFVSEMYKECKRKNLQAEAYALRERLNDIEKRIAGEDEQ